MVARTLTISMSQEDWDYLQQDDLLSPSKIFQVALNNIKESRANLNEEIRRLRVANNVLQAKLLEANDNIDMMKGGKI